MPARGIIAQLQIIGQTPLTPLIRASACFTSVCVSRVRGSVYVCVSVCIRACEGLVGSADSGTLHARYTVYSVDSGRGGSPPKTVTPIEGPRAAPSGLEYSSLPFPPFQPTRPAFFRRLYRRRHPLLPIFLARVSISAGRC